MLSENTTTIAQPLMSLGRSVFKSGNWAVTVLGALLAVAFSAEVPILGYGSTVTVVAFFFLEAIYMNIEHDVIQRSNHLEELINHHRTTGQLREPYNFGVSYAYRGNFTSGICAA